MYIQFTNQMIGQLILIIKTHFLFVTIKLTRNTQRVALVVKVYLV